jgi:hypothetical protein
LVNPEGKNPLGKPRHRWVDDFKMDIVEIGWGGVAEDGDNWGAFVNAVMNLGVP